MQLHFMHWLMLFMFSGSSSAEEKMQGSPTVVLTLNCYDKVSEDYICGGFFRDEFTVQFDTL